MKAQIATMRKTWNEVGGLSLEQRRHKLQTLKKVIELRQAAIAKALKTDLGKGAFESYSSEVGFILGDIKFALKNLSRWSRIRKVGTPLSLMPARSFIMPEPLGVVLILAPWNYPFQLSFSPLVGAISAGNRVVLKPSEFSIETTKIIRSIVEEVFTSSEVLVLEGGASETQDILKEKFDHIFFTGSTQIGKVVMRAAAEHLTPVTLELGGKSPFLVDASANIDKAAKRCVWGKFMNAGQTCVAPDYVLVPKDKEQEFTECLKVHIENFYGRNPEDSEDYGRMISARHLERLGALISPDKVVVGGVINKESRYLAPTVLRNISWDDEIMASEIFGPILPVLTYTDLSSVLHEIKARPRPLAFYLFSEDKKNMDHVLAEVSFGGGCINDTVVHLANHQLPFGGVGDSGMGSYHGRKSFETFTHFKSVLRNTTRVDIPIRYPPYKGKLGLLKFFLG
jgi:aldehyde dehydrogenase (NAD+)